MICELIEKPNYLINEINKQREFLLINIRFAEKKILNKKENDNNTTSD